VLKSVIKVAKIIVSNSSLKFIELFALIIISPLLPTHVQRIVGVNRAHFPHLIAHWPKSAVFSYRKDRLVHPT
jgi:hypothetical protein